jgi:hypothetical protein
MQNASQIPISCFKNSPQTFRLLYTYDVVEKLKRFGLRMKNLRKLTPQRAWQRRLKIAATFRLLIKRFQTDDADVITRGLILKTFLTHRLMLMSWM